MYEYYTDKEKQDAKDARYILNDVQFMESIDAEQKKIVDEIGEKATPVETLGDMYRLIKWAVMTGMSRGILRGYVHADRWRENIKRHAELLAAVTEAAKATPEPGWYRTQTAPFSLIEIIREESSPPKFWFRRDGSQEWCLFVSGYFRLVKVERAK